MVCFGKTPCVLVCLLLLVQYASTQSCLPHPEQCMKMADCCSRNCYVSDQDKNISGICQQGSECTDGGGKCTQRDDCCSYNCYMDQGVGECQAAGGDRCTADTAKCTDSTQCCSLYCDDVGLCSLATNTVLPSMFLISVTWVMTSLV